MPVRILMTSLLLTAFVSNNVLAENVCLEDLTDAAKSAKQCIVSSDDPAACKSELKTLEIQELICERDGFPKDKIQLSVKIGNMMADGKIEDSALARFVAGIVSSHFDPQINTLKLQVAGMQTELKAVDSGLITVDGRVLQLRSDMEFQLHVERDERAKLAADLNAKIKQVSQSGGTNVELERRLRTIEERLKAIDASRASLNAELLKVQGQVNGLMIDRSVR